MEFFLKQLKKTMETKTDNATAEVATAYYLRQVAERLSISLAQALKPFDTNRSAYRVLIALARQNPSTMRDLGEATLLVPSTLSRTVEQLRQSGSVHCEPDEGDARALKVTMTAKGEQHLAEILPSAAAQYQWAIQGIDTKDLEAMHRTLKKMLSNLKKSPIK